MYFEWIGKIHDSDFYTKRLKGKEWFMTAKMTNITMVNTDFCDFLLVQQ